MEPEKIVVFKPYPFKPGQKIHIKGSKRSGDWEVVEVTETKVTLKCPVSFKQVTWDRFCYFADETVQKWPCD